MSIFQYIVFWGDDVFHPVVSLLQHVTGIVLSLVFLPVNISFHELYKY